jgi:GTP cyclohydrolase IA
MLSQEAIAVKEALESLQLENPSLLNNHSDAEKVETIQYHMSAIMQSIGLDLTDQSLSKSPHRIAKMYIEEIFSGLNYANFPKITTVPAQSGQLDMIKIDNILMNSTCEHHFVPIQGQVKVAYIPNEKLLGLSKLNRIVQFFCRRPQLQERLTQQIKTAIQVISNSKDVAVHIKATHHCVLSRGIRDINSITTTSSYGGAFQENFDLKREFLGN